MSEMVSDLLLILAGGLIGFMLGEMFSDLWWMKLAREAVEKLKEARELNEQMRLRLEQLRVREATTEADRGKRYETDARRTVQ